MGDWIGPEGLLAEVSFASAKRAAEQILKAEPKIIVSSIKQMETRLLLSK
jgi:hypothetical protein